MIYLPIYLAILGDLFGMASLRDPNSMAKSNRDLQIGDKLWSRCLNHLAVDFYEVN